MQSGFRAHHSTSTALLKVTSDIASAIDKGHIVLLMLLDYSKAFDCVNHNLLLSKLKYYGCGSTLCTWLRNYLSDRSHMVSLRGKLSNSITVHQGLPQGSILSPLLFSICTADLPTILDPPIVPHLYADDNQMTISCNPANINSAAACLNRNLKKVCEWSTSNGLKLNPGKCKCICIGSPIMRLKALNILNTDIMVNDVIIKLSDCEKNLGVLIDRHLSFHEHVSKKCKTAFYILRSLNQFKHTLTAQVKWALCESLVISQIDYCLIVYYDFLTQDFKNKLQLVQNSCLRFSFNIRWLDHVTPHYNSLGILKIEHRHTYFNCNLIYTILTSSLPRYLLDLLIRRSSCHNVNTRNANQFSTPPFATTKFMCCFAFRAPSLANLHFDLLFAGASKSIFKQSMKSRLLAVQSH